VSALSALLGAAWYLVGVVALILVAAVVVRSWPRGK